MHLKRQRLQFRIHFEHRVLFGVSVGLSVHKSDGDRPVICNLQHEPVHADGSLIRALRQERRNHQVRWKSALLLERYKGSAESCVQDCATEGGQL